MTTTPNDLRDAVLRVAGIIETHMTQCAIYRDGAPITDQVLVYAMLPVDPATAFDWDVWTVQFRQTRRDGSRPHVLALRDALHAFLAEELGGEIGLTGGGTHYTPVHIRKAASALAV